MACGLAKNITGKVVLVTGAGKRLGREIALSCAKAGWRVAVVLHTLESDWAKQQIAGMVGIFGDCGAAVIDVVDCSFSPDLQVAELDRLVALRPDAIISLPVANEQVAAAHRRVSEAGIKLVLLDNAPTGLLPGNHYGTLVSADNFGLGLIAVFIVWHVWRSRAH